MNSTIHLSWISWLKLASRLLDTTLRLTFIINVESHKHQQTYKPRDYESTFVKKFLIYKEYFFLLLPTVSSNKRQRNHWDVPSHGYPGDSLCLHKWKPHGWLYAFQVDDYFPAENVHRWGPGYEPTGRWACSFCGVDINKDLNNTFKTQYCHAFVWITPLFFNEDWNYPLYFGPARVVNNIRYILSPEKGNEI